MLLTGTPILNRPIETFPLLNALDPKGFKSAFRFGKTYCNAQHNGYGWDFTGANKARLPELQERLRSSIMVRRLKADVLKELPEKRRQVVCLPQNGGSSAVKAEQDAYASHKAAIEELEEDVTLAQISGDEAAYKAAVAALSERVRHAFTEIARARKNVALAKVEKVVEHVNNMMESGIEKVIVWAHHHEVTDKLAAELGAMKADGRDKLEDRQAAVDAFQNDPSKKVIVCGIRAMGEGHTLTAASHVVFAELDWTPAKMSQCEDRAHRIGQTEMVLVQHLVLDGSLDATMAAALVEKQDVADRGLDSPTSLQVTLVPERKGRPSKYPVPTQEEREAAAGAMQLLASMCDGAVAEDMAGFSKVDTRFGKQLAGRSVGRPLTDGEVFWARKLARRYRRQLPGTLRATLGCDA
jgi:SWI/SNF-related matrix-associated actin-dependent regulator 1 of chromatin subfamily A